ncbi:MAG: hypothetical protein ABIK73_07045 [candidate division WOR-3 bacterium]
MNEYAYCCFANWSDLGTYEDECITANRVNEYIGRDIFSEFDPLNITIVEEEEVQTPLYLHLYRAVSCEEPLAEHLITKRVNLKSLNLFMEYCRRFLEKCLESHRENPMNRDINLDQVEPRWTYEKPGVYKMTTDRWTNEFINLRYVSFFVEGLSTETLDNWVTEHKLYTRDNFVTRLYRNIPIEERTTVFPEFWVNVGPGTSGDIAWRSFSPNQYPPHTFLESFVHIRDREEKFIIFPTIDQLFDAPVQKNLREYGQKNYAIYWIHGLEQPNLRFRTSTRFVTQDALMWLFNREPNLGQFYDYRAILPEFSSDGSLARTDYDFILIERTPEIQQEDIVNKFKAWAVQDWNDVLLEPYHYANNWYVPPSDPENFNLDHLLLLGRFSLCTFKARDLETGQMITLKKNLPVFFNDFSAGKYMVGGRKRRLRYKTLANSLVPSSSKAHLDYSILGKFWQITKARGEGSVPKAFPRGEDVRARVRFLIDGIEVFEREYDDGEGEISRGIQEDLIIDTPTIDYSTEHIWDLVIEVYSAKNRVGFMRFYNARGEIEAERNRYSEYFPNDYVPGVDTHALVSSMIWTDVNKWRGKYWNTISQQPTLQMLDWWNVVLGFMQWECDLRVEGSVFPYWG